MSISMSGLASVRGIRVESPEAMDPYFSNVALLLHGDGTNGSTSIIDSGPLAKTVTASGVCSITTAIKKYGTGSVYINAGQASVPPTGLYNSDFAYGTGDFTIEAWVYVNAGGGGYQYIHQMTWGSGTHNIGIGFGDSGMGSRLHFGVITSTQDRIYSISDTSYTMAGAWHHLAMVRASGNVSLYKNGQLQAIRANNYSGPDVTSFADNSNISNPTDVRVGHSSYPLNGQIDEFRITRGVARYTGNFTPPAAAFPNS